MASLLLMTDRVGRCELLSVVGDGLSQCVAPSLSHLLLLCGDVERNPGPADENTNNLIKELGASLKAQITDVSQELHTMSNAMKSLSAEINKVKKQVDINEAEIAAMGDRTDTMGSKIQRLEEKLENQERHLRRDNIILYGVPEEEGASENNCVNSVVKIFNNHDPSNTWVSSDISCAYRLGKKVTQQDRPRPLLAKLVRYRDKRNLIASKVARTRLSKDGVRIDDDLTPSQRTSLSALRNEGFLAYYRGNRLVQRVRQETTEVGSRRTAAFGLQRNDRPLELPDDWAPPALVGDGDQETSPAWRREGVSVDESNVPASQIAPSQCAGRGRGKGRSPPHSGDSATTNDGTPRGFGRGGSHRTCSPTFNSSIAAASSRVGDRDVTPGPRPKTRLQTAGNAGAGGGGESRKQSQSRIDVMMREQS